jgi:putative ABC transport system permease protein
MMKNYFLLAIRNIKRNKVFAFINVFGLSIGLAACILIFLYTKDEWSFDRFHENSNQLYQLTCRISEKDGSGVTYGISANVHGPAFKAAVPEIKEINRVRDEDVIIKTENQSYEEKMLWVDNNFFEMFSFPLVQGAKKNVLSDLHSIVITEPYAKKFFGDQNPIGKLIEIEVKDSFVAFTVTGIAKEAPQNSSIKFNIVAPFDCVDKMENNPAWLMLSYPTYMVLNKNADTKAISAKMQKVFDNSAPLESAVKNGFTSKFNWGLQPLVNMHLNKDIEATRQASDPVYSYILSCIALFILIIACINFINLMIAQSLKRSKEIGVRKVIGGSRKQLFFQFISEAFSMCLLAFVFAIILAQLALPYFNSLAGKTLSLGYLADKQLILGFIALFVITVLASGFYPALVLSAMDPVQTLYKRVAFSRKNYLVKGLVVLQFSLATFLIIGTLFIYNQLSFMHNKSLGYDDKNLLQIDISKGNDENLLRQFKTQVAALNNVKSIGTAMDGSWNTVTKANDKEFETGYQFIDEAFLPTMKIPILAGRNFSKDYPADTTHSVLVNEAYVRAAGWKGNAVGKHISYLNGMACDLEIVGIVKDYHTESLKEKISPQLFSSQAMFPLKRFFIRVDANNTSKTISQIENIYHTLLPYHPFQYNFVDDLNFKNYEEETKWKQIISLASVLTVLISCIGLFGLSSLAVQKRVKEIGVRKVLGASVFQISNLLTRNFLLLIAIAFVIAVPAAWYASNSWLQNFAYRIEINWYVFAFALVITLLVGVITISLQTIKAALVNPVKSLRSE